MSASIVRLTAAVALLVAGCAANPGPRATVESCNAEVERLSALLAAETAERQRMARAATRREDTLRRQLEAMKSIERGILERERVRSESR